MRRMKLSVCGLAVAGLLALAPAAAAATDGTQTVTGTSTGDLSLSIPVTAVTGAVLTPGQTAGFTATAIDVIAPNAATTAWSLNVKDATNGGKLQKTADLACVTASDASINDALDFTSTTSVQTEGGATGSVGTTDVVVAGGNSLTDVVTIDYSVDVPDTAQLAAACPYSTTLTYTLTG